MRARAMRGMGRRALGMPSTSSSAAARSPTFADFVLPAPANASASGAIYVVATVSDKAGATATWEGKATVADAFADLSPEQLTASVGNLMAGALAQAQQKGDVGGAFNLLANGAAKDRKSVV